MAGVDIANKFPSSRMALAVKLGQSRFISVDTPTQPVNPSQINTAITNPAGTALTVPPTIGDARPATYAVITAVGGPLYATYDGTVPSATNYDITIVAGQSLPVTGPNTLTAIRVFGTSMDVSYWS